MRKKEKRSISICLFFYVFSIFGAIIFLAGPAIPAETITLRFSNPMPPKGVEYEAFTWMMDEITKRTNGGLKVQSFHGGSLLTMRETLRGIQQGTADIGNIPTPYHPKELQLWSVSTPFIRGPSTIEKRTAFFWDLYEQSPELKEELANLNQKLFTLFSFSTYGIGGPYPLKTLNSLKGIRVRCAGGYDAKHMTDLGAKVVFLKGPEVYSAMQKGAIDANYAPLTTYFKYRLYEIGTDKHFLIIPQFVGIVGLVTINLDSWNRLPSDYQQIVSEVGKEFSTKHAQKTSHLEQQYRQKLLSAGVTILEVSKEEVARWAEMTEGGSKVKWIKEAEDQGKPGKELMNLTSRLIKKYSE